MLLTAASGHAVTSNRRPTRPSFAESSLQSTCIISMPIYGFSHSSATEKAKDTHDYSNILTEVTDADEVYTEQCEAAAAGENLMWSQEDVKSLCPVPNEMHGSPSAKKMQTRSTAILDLVQKSEQLDCTSLRMASEYTELLFDAESPFESDENLALRSGSAPRLTPQPLTHPVARNHDKPCPTLELLDVSHLRIQPTLAVQDFRDHVSKFLDLDASPATDQAQDAIPESTARRDGRSLVHSFPLIFAGQTATEEPWQLEYNPVLRYATSSSLLPGLEHLRNITARSATIQYDHNIEDLYRANTSFIDGCHDDECLSLNNEMHTLRVPGENFMLADNGDNIDLSGVYPTTEDIFQSIDALVNADMFDVYEVHRGIPEDMLPLTKGHSDTNPQAPELSDLLLYPSNFDAPLLMCDNENNSDVSDSDPESLPLTQHSKLNYVDTDTHQYISYTALNQLLAMEEGETRPVIHRDTPDDDEDLAEIGLAELVYLPPTAEVCATLQPPRNSSNPNRSSSNIHSAISRPPIPVQPGRKRQRAARRKCEPYGLYSSNRSRHQRQIPQLRLATQLLPNRRPLSIISENESPCSSSSSSGKSLDFANHRGFVKPMESRRLGFLDDEAPESPAMPISSSDCINDDLKITDLKDYEYLFTNAIWHNTPVLTFDRRNQEAYVGMAPASAAPSPLPMALEIEIHNRLAFMFNCINNGILDELPALSSDLHWTLCALVDDNPALTLLDSLGVAIELLVERMLASTTAS